MDEEVLPCPDCGEPTAVPPGGAARCGLCGATVRSSEDLWEGDPGDAPQALDQAAEADRVEAEMDRLTALRKKLNLLSFAFALPGLVLGTVGNIMVEKAGPADDGAMLASLAVLGSGALLFIVGLGCYAVYKGRHPAWGLLGGLCCIGLLVLAVLPDKNKRRLEELRERLIRLPRR